MKKETTFFEMGLTPSSKESYLDSEEHHTVVMIQNCPEGRTWGGEGRKEGQ